MPLAAGQRLAHYEVLGPLGAGAMGEVWRARDTRLDREVALKVLPDELAGDAERLARFEREARTLASLNHPGVAQVYGIDREAETSFIAMELVPGEDLAQRLARGPLSSAEAVEVCARIAEALEAAHEAGVIHRDVKPANVLLTPEGSVKVLDFGLAKPALPGEREGTDTALATAAGQVLGTPAYMAPEQARGRPLDRRVDVWAFGCVLYECLTGRRAFEGDTLSDVLAAVLEREPDWSRLPAGTPEHVRALLERCLDKDPRKRLRDVGEARIALAGDAPAPAPQAARRGVSAPAALALALVAAAGTWVATRGGAPAAEPQTPLAGATFTKVTDGPATEFDAAISVDGKYLSFASDRGGRFDAWMAPVGGVPRNLTLGGKEFWALKVRDQDFDRDGRHLVLSGGTDGWCHRVSLFEPGEVRRFHHGPVNVRWSPDGTRAVFHSAEKGDPLYVADADLQNERAIGVVDPGLHQHYPAWSSDGAWIYFVRGRPATQEMDLWRMRPDGGDPERLTTDLRDVAYPTPLDAETVLFVALDAAGAGPWLWALDVETRTARRATVGVERYTSVAASRDGRRLVATVANPRPGLWRVPLPVEGVVGEDRAERLPELASVAAAAPRCGAGESLHFLSLGGVWRRRGEEVEPVLSAEWQAALEPPAVAPDGATLAVVSRKRGAARLHVVSAEGVVGPPLGEPLEVQGSPAWSPDGEHVAIGGTDAEGAGLFVVPKDGGPARRLVRGYALNPVWSPRGDLIAYAGQQLMALHTLSAVRYPDGAPVEGWPEIGLLRGGERVRFLPSGRGLVYMQYAGVGQDFWLLDLDTLVARQLTRLADAGPMRTFDVDPSGEHIVFDRLQLNSDVVLIEREPAEGRRP